MRHAGRLGDCAHVSNQVRLDRTASRRLGSCPIRCAARCGYFLMAHRGADRAAVKPLRETWPRSWAVIPRPLREPCAENPHPRSPPPQINRGSGAPVFISSSPQSLSFFLPPFLLPHTEHGFRRRRTNSRTPTSRRQTTRRTPWLRTPPPPHCHIAAVSSTSSLLLFFFDGIESRVGLLFFLFFLLFFLCSSPRRHIARRR